MVQERIGPGLTMITDENAAYKSLKEWWYDHRHDAAENGPELSDQLLSSSGI